MSVKATISACLVSALAGLAVGYYTGGEYIRRIFLRLNRRMTDEEIRKAKMLGLTPAKLLSMIPSRQESWKDPVALRIHRLWDRKEER